VPGLEDADIDRLIRYVAAAGYFVVAVGLWTFRRWAWAALMIVVGLSLAEGIVFCLRGEPRYATMLCNVLIVFYLNQRELQHLFQSGYTTNAAS
jgi:uncharacterized membrane protein (DUF2068 family)